LFAPTTILPFLSFFLREMGLPLRMENLHAPTVPSGPTTVPALNGSQTNGLTFAQLQAKKDNIEAEIRALGSVLESVGSPSNSVMPGTEILQHGVDMNTRLLTPDGFPRADIDVAQSNTSCRIPLVREILNLVLQFGPRGRV